MALAAFAGIILLALASILPLWLWRLNIEDLAPAMAPNMNASLSPKIPLDATTVGE